MISLVITLDVLSFKDIETKGLNFGHHTRSTPFQLITANFGHLPVPFCAIAFKNKGTLLVSFPVTWQTSYGLFT